MKLSGWGRFPVRDCRVVLARAEADVTGAVESGALIARGNGRGYGDCALNPDATLDMRRCNRFLSFDPATGQVVAEAGVLLSDVIETFLPRGWFPYVTPGTKFVTLGGMIAADVHGKNHHKEGSFAQFVDWIDIACADSVVRRCSRNENAELFDWTLGGMGLTGVLLRAAFRLRPVETGWIRQTTIATPDLNATMRVFEETSEATYSVAWIDCLARGADLGRSLIMLGEHAGRDEVPGEPFPVARKQSLAVPFDFPSATLNRLTVSAFNRLYYAVNRRKTGAPALVGWDSYFYPLDAIHHWNRIYGRRGFAQFQCVLPLADADAGLREILGAVAEAGSGSFLAVLKRFGPGRGGFSFPMAGYTLALDFPVSPKTLALLDRLDAIVIARGGRFYLAKDSRMSAEGFRKSDTRTAAFSQLRETAGMTGRFRSVQSERLGL